MGVNWELGNKIWKKVKICALFEWMPSFSQHEMISLVCFLHFIYLLLLFLKIFFLQKKKNMFHGVRGNVQLPFSCTWSIFCSFFIIFLYGFCTKKEFFISMLFSQFLPENKTFFLSSFFILYAINKKCRYFIKFFVFTLIFCLLVSKKLDFFLIFSIICRQPLTWII